MKKDTPIFLSLPPLATVKSAQNSQTLKSICNKHKGALIAI